MPKLTVLARVEKVLSKITPEYSLLQDAALLQFPARGSRQDEAAEEGDQLPVLPQHGLGRLARGLGGGGVPPGVGWG